MQNIRSWLSKMINWRPVPPVARLGRKYRENKTHFSATTPLMSSSGSSRKGSGSKSRKVPPLKKSRSASNARRRSIFLQKKREIPLEAGTRLQLSDSLLAEWLSLFSLLFAVTALLGHGFHDGHQSVEELLLSVEDGPPAAPLLAAFGQGLWVKWIHETLHVCFLSFKILISFF